MSLKNFSSRVLILSGLAVFLVFSVPYVAQSLDIGQTYAAYAVESPSTLWIRHVGPNFNSFTQIADASAVMAPAEPDQVIASVPTVVALPQDGVQKVLAYLMPIMQDFLLLVASTLTAFLGKKLHDWFSLTVTDQQNKFLQGILENGASLAYGWLVKEAATLHDPQFHDKAVQMVVDYALESIPDTLKKMGVDKSHLISMAQAKIGDLLVQDPSITLNPLKATVVSSTMAPLIPAT